MQGHVLDLLHVLVWSRGDDAGGDRAGLLEVREPVLGQQRLAGGVEPVVGEGVGQLLDDRPFALEMGVEHDERRVVGADVLGADVETAGVGQPPIDHHDLTMVAQVHERRPPRQV